MLNLFETIKTHPEYFKQLACKVLLCTQYDCPQQKELKELYSEHNFIVYVLSGKRILFQPGHTYEMTEGKCVFSKKGGWLAQKEHGTNWRVMIFFMPDSYLQQFCKKYSTSFSPGGSQIKATLQMVDLHVNNATRSFFESMMVYFMQSPPLPEALLELKFHELLFTLLANPDNKDLLFYLNKIAAHHRESLSEIMEANYTYNLSLKEFARLTHLSLASFKREFKKVFGTTPGKWLKEKRLDHAGKILSTSSKSISDVAFESGFENTTHFSRVFKEKFHETPLHYRQLIVADLVDF
jgi:AraC-like DNA-binding protein